MSLIFLAVDHQMVRWTIKWSDVPFTLWNLAEETKKIKQRHVTNLFSS